jgi:membrane protease YdiL (CAAX protease family)
VPIDIETDFYAGTHTRFAERVNKGQTSIYADVLAAYDARLDRYPDDVTTSIERCRFIEAFAYSEDSVIKSSNEDLEDCREKLHNGPHRDDVDVILYKVESIWGDEKKLAEVQALIPQSRDWTRDQRATLFELLAGKYWSTPDLAAGYAIQAVSLRPGSHVLLTAVQRWIQLGAKDKARKLLIEAPESTWAKVPRVSAAKLLIDLGDPKAAARLLRADKSNAFGADRMLARVLAETGEIDAARDLYRAAVLKQKYVAHESRVEYFEFERQYGSGEQAMAAYEQLRNEGFGADILARQRLSLLAAYPGAAWHWEDVAGLLLILGLALAYAVLPVVTIAPIHYRGLARRLAGLAPETPAPKWSLRHAWYALGVIWISGLISLYVFFPESLEKLLPWTKRMEASATDIVLGNHLLCGTVLALLMVGPLLRGRSVKALLMGRWSVLKSVLSGIGLAIALKVVAAVIAVSIQSMGALGSETIRAMQGVHQSFGLAAMLLVVGVAVPFVEELVFRGVMLEAFRGHVTFMFATVAQAATFAAAHESYGDMPVLFVFGLVAGWLARRSGGLLAPMAMHSAFNISSALAIVGMTAFLNR